MVVKDGKACAVGMDTVVNKVKPFIRKLRKSGKLKDAFRSCQELEELPEKNLELGIDIRWNSLYLMLKSFADNKKAIQMFCIERNIEENLILTNSEWKLVEDFVVSLKKFYNATLVLQCRDTTISYVIPIVKAITHDLEVKQALKLGNEELINGLLNSINERFDSCFTKLHLVIATFLDPRFKADFFEEAILDLCKKWIVEELVGTATPRAVQEVEIAADKPDDLFADVLRVTKPPQTVRPPLDQSDLKHVIQGEILTYLSEPTLSRDSTAGSYWKINSGRFENLSKLYCKYGTAPATSAEAERLFSVAGLILTEMRKRLSDENLKKLLFLSCNLKIFNYDY